MQLATYTGVTVGRWANYPEMTVGRQVNYPGVTILRRELNRPPAAYIRAVLVAGSPPHESFVFVATPEIFSAFFAFA